MRTTATGNHLALVDSLSQLPEAQRRSGTTSPTCPSMSWLPGPGVPTGTVEARLSRCRAAPALPLGSEDSDAARQRQIDDATRQAAPVVAATFADTLAGCP